jgi:ceramide glucosyltransferase
MDTLELVFCAATLLSATVYVVMHAAFHVRVVRDRFLRSRDSYATRHERTTTHEFVSILKPLAGSDDELALNLASFARLADPSYELLLGIASLRDPACPIARKFVDEHPELRARVVLTNSDAAMNPKVAQLVGLLACARGEIVVISDANVRVGPQYLAHLREALALPNTGLVTSSIVGAGEVSLGASLENLQLMSHIAPGVAALDSLTPTTISIGKSMAMRRVDLARIGGLESVANLLAEDHMLGVQFAAAGFKVRLCTDPVHNYNVHTRVQRSLERHTRWAKMRRCIAPLPFYFEPLLVPVLVASFGLLAHPSRATALAFVAASCLQMAGATLAVLSLRGRMRAVFVPLEIIRSFASLYMWLCAVCSLRVNWRGHPFVLGPRSRLISAPESTPGSRARRRKGVWSQIRLARLVRRTGG